ncbi:MAG TPA: AAA family ATPase [Pyrinomonadaceae bacterium]|jgi:deoxyadenosine/deoxycytidine kinase
MPIICFEGASAVGKTSLSKYLSENFNAYAIPEVNLLFQRMPDEPKFWYFEKQVERWELAVKAAKNYQIVILDGDPFQPLWYNWAYNFDVLQPLETIADFYREKLVVGKIAFPDKYFILTANNDDLRNRKSNDALRARKNFERHLQFIKPQLAFFDFIKSINNDLVEFIENMEVEITAVKIMNSIPLQHSNQDSSLALFDAAKIWLTETQATDFT